MMHDERHGEQKRNDSGNDTIDIASIDLASGEVRIDGADPSAPAEPTAPLERTPSVPTAVSAEIAARYNLALPESWPSPQTQERPAPSSASEGHAAAAASDDGCEVIELDLSDLAASGDFDESALVAIAESLTEICSPDSGVLAAEVPTFSGRIGQASIRKATPEKVISVINKQLARARSPYAVATVSALAYPIFRQSLIDLSESGRYIRIELLPERVLSQAFIVFRFQGGATPPTCKVRVMTPNNLESICQGELGLACSLFCSYKGERLMDRLARTHRKLVIGRWVSIALLAEAIVLSVISMLGGFYMPALLAVCLLLLRQPDPVSQIVHPDGGIQALAYGRAQKRVCANPTAAESFTGADSAQVARQMASGSFSVAASIAYILAVLCLIALNAMFLLGAISGGAGDAASVAGMADSAGTVSVWDVG